MHQTSLNNKTESLVAEINQITEKFIREFAGCSPEEMLYKPSKETWSIAENIQHLIELNTSYYPIFSQLLAGSYRPAWSGSFSLIYKFLGNIILKSVNEDRKKKIKTFPLWLPDKKPLTDDILDRFQTHQGELIEWIRKLAPFLGKRTVINSPANRIISYTLDDALEILIMHEKRHLNQAIEVRDKK